MFSNIKRLSFGRQSIKKIDPTKKGCSALNEAVHTGNAHRVKVLLEKISADKDDFHIAFWHACVGLRLEIVKLFFTHGANGSLRERTGGQHLLLEVCNLMSHQVSSKVAGVALQLLENGADPNPGNNAKGETPLTIAIEANQVELVTTLLQKGARPNDRCILIGEPLSLGTTPLCLAVESPSANQLVPLLLQHGADVHQQSGQEQTTVLHGACASGSLELVQLLVDAGSDIHATTGPEEGATPLMYASTATSSESIAVMKLLIGLGANPSTFIDPQQGRTLLHQICSFRRTFSIEKAQLLLDSGVDVNKRDKYGETALMLALSSDDEVIEFLLENGADPNIAGVGRLTPLHCIAGNKYRDQLNILKHLLNVGANPSLTDIRGQSPFDVACKTGNTDYITVLRPESEGLAGECLGLGALTA